MLMQEIVRALRTAPPARLEKMVREHRVDLSGHCPLCRTVGCTLYSAALAARRPNGT
jgi:hypothetical protein